MAVSCIKDDSAFISTRPTQGNFAGSNQAPCIFSECIQIGLMTHQFAEMDSTVEVQRSLSGSQSPRAPQRTDDRIAGREESFRGLETCWEEQNLLLSLAVPGSLMLCAGLQRPVGRP